MLMEGREGPWFLFPLFPQYPSRRAMAVRSAGNGTDAKGQGERRYASGRTLSVVQDKEEEKEKEKERDTGNTGPSTG